LEKEVIAQWTDSTVWWKRTTNLSCF